MGFQPATPEYRRLLAALFFIGVATFAQLYSPQGLLPLVALDLKISADESALMISSATLGLALGVIPWSYIGDAYGRKQAMLMAILLACLFAFLTVAMPVFWLALAMRFIEGFMLGGVPALAVAYLSEEVSSKAVAVAAGTYIAGTTIGGLSGRIIAVPIGEQWGWESGVMAISCIAVLCVLAFLKLAPRARHFVPGSRQPGTAVNQLLGNLRSPTLWVVYIQGFLTMGGFVAMYNYLAFHLASPPFSLPLWLTSLVFLAYLAGTISSPRAGVLAVRHGRKKVLIGANLVLLSGVGLTLIPHLVAIIVGVVVLTAGFFAAHAVASGWAGTSAVTGRSQSASLYNLGYYGGSSVFGYLGGTFLHWAGWPGTVAMVAALGTVATVLVLMVLPRD